MLKKLCKFLDFKTVFGFPMRLLLYLFIVKGLLGLFGHPVFIESWN